MELSQVNKFLQESIYSRRTWKRIRILGGEPFVHPEICDIVNSLLLYKEDHNPLVELEVVTNGFGQDLEALRLNISKKVTVVNTFKNTPIGNKFDPFNLAPKDSWKYGFVDFSNGCWITAECGIGLTPFGYYHCAIAGGIDRILGLDLGYKSLPDIEENYKSMMRKLCSWCGHFKIGYHESSKIKQPLKRQFTSKSWQKIYRNYIQNPPILTTY